MPFYLVSADGDQFGIAFETALFFKRIFEKQPQQVELRVVDGDHDWKVWESSIDDAMRYIFKFAEPPHAVARTAKATSLDSFSHH